MASIQKRTNKKGEVISYQIKVSRGRDKLTGKQLTPYTTTFVPPEGWSKKSIERALQRAAGEFEAACKRGEVEIKSKTKADEIASILRSNSPCTVEEFQTNFSEYTNSLIKRLAPTLSITTLQNYTSLTSKAAKVFGDTPIGDITSNDIKDYLDGLSTGERPLRGSSIVAHCTALRVVFKEAVEDGTSPVNPMDKVKRPKINKDEFRKAPASLDEKQVSHVFKCLEHEPLRWQAVLYCTSQSILGAGGVKSALCSGAMLI